jgi:hypothetical protein
MDNSTNPDSVDANFKAIQGRLRRTGVQGIVLAEGDNTKTMPPAEREKEFEQRKRGMTVEGGIAVFKPNTRNVPNARKRNETSNDSGIKVFAVGEEKSEDKEK